MVLGQEFSEFLVGRLLEHSFLPQIWSQIGVGGSNSGVCSLGKVAQCTSGSSGRCVTIINTSHLEQLLRNWSRHNTSTTGGGDQSHPDGATLSSHLAGHSVWATNLVTPETSSDWDNGELGEDDSSSDGSGNLLGALDTKTNMSVVVTNS